MGSECSCIKGHSDPVTSFDMYQDSHCKQPMQSHGAPEVEEFFSTPQKEIDLKATDPSSRRSWISTALAKLPISFSGKKEAAEAAEADSAEHQVGSGLKVLSEFPVDEQACAGENLAEIVGAGASLLGPDGQQNSTAGGPPQLDLLSSDEVMKLTAHPTITALRQQLGRLYLDPLDPSVTVYKAGPVKWKSLIIVAEWTSAGATYGRGCIFSPDEYCYEGYIIDGRKEVFGRILFADGSYYMGCFSNDHADGEGKYWQDSGAVLEGVFHNGRVSNGIETRPDGAQYKGEFRQWKWHGVGSLVRADGSHYSGQFAKGKFNGQGTLVMASGHKYEGEWQNDKMHGSGRFTWNDGSVYEGEYANDEKHGYGELITADGTTYRGGWNYGKRHGESKEIRVDSAGRRHRRTRIWNNGVLQES